MHYPVAGGRLPGDWSGGYAQVGILAAGLPDSRVFREINASLVASIGAWLTARHLNWAVAVRGQPGLAGRKRTGEDRFAVVMAALAHDFGKVTHTQRAGGRIISHGHAEAGIEPAREFFRSVGCPEGITGRILPLIREHMCCTDRPTKPAVRRLARRLQPATLAELTIVCGADRAGRGDPDAPNPALAWLEVGRNLSITERPAKGLLTGDHLIAAGMTPGPPFRPLLAAALAAQDNGEFDTEAGARRWLEERMAS